MPKYKFTVTRDITESVECEVEADSIEEAHTKALEDIDKYSDKDSFGNTQWDADCGPVGDCYIPDPEGFEII